VSHAGAEYAIRNDSRHWREAGFTLLELVIATFIAALVVGTLAATLTVTLRIWERHRGSEGAGHEVTRILELLALQLATFNAHPVSLEEERQPVFRGDARSLTFATNTSLMALSRAVPIVARYVYIPEKKKLYYAELPFDPYHGELIEEFISRDLSQRNIGPRYHELESDVLEWSLSYLPRESNDYRESSEEFTELPQSIRVRVSARQGRKTVTVTRVLDPHFLRFGTPAKPWTEHGKAS
jgi:hypothetical protein